MVCMKHPMLRVKATFVLVKSSCLLFGLLDLHFCLVNSICHHFSCLHPLSLLNLDVSLSNPQDSLFLKIKSTFFSTSNSPVLALQDVDLQRWDLETIQDPLRRKHWDPLGLDLEGAASGDGRNLWKFSWMDFKMMVQKGASCQKLAGYWCFPEKIWFVQNTLIEIQSMMKIQVLTTSNRGFLNHQCKDQLCGAWIFMIFLGYGKKIEHQISPQRLLLNWLLFSFHSSWDDEWTYFSSLRPSHWQRQQHNHFTCWKGSKFLKLTSSRRLWRPPGATFALHSVCFWWWSVSRHLSPKWMWWMLEAPKLFRKDPAPGWDLDDLRDVKRLDGCIFLI